MRTSNEETTGTHKRVQNEGTRMNLNQVRRGDEEYTRTRAWFAETRDNSESNEVVPKYILFFNVYFKIQSRPDVEIYHG